MCGIIEVSCDALCNIYTTKKILNAPFSATVCGSVAERCAKKMKRISTCRYNKMCKDYLNRKILYPPSSPSDGPLSLLCDETHKTANSDKDVTSCERDKLYSNDMTSDVICQKRASAISSKSASAGSSHKNSCGEKSKGVARSRCDDTCKMKTVRTVCYPPSMTKTSSAAPAAHSCRRRSVKKQSVGALTLYSNNESGVAAIGSVEGGETSPRVCGPPEKSSIVLESLEWELRHYETQLCLRRTVSQESSSDSEVDETMGNSHSKKSTPSVYYAPGYGVALGSRPPSLTLDEENIVDLSRETTDHNGVRLRQTRRTTRHKSPSPASDKDSAIGGIVGSEMSQSLYSENSINRDSFYSTCTAESGFDEYWNCHHSEESRTGLKSGSFGAGSSSLHPNQTRERNIHMLYRAHHGHDPGLNSLRRSAKPGLDTLSDVSSERSGIVSARSQLGSSSDSVSSVSNYPQKTNVDPLLEKFASERASLNGARPGSRQTMVSSGHSGVEEVGDVGQQHFSLSETTSPIGNRRAGNVHTKPTDRTDIANVADLMPEMTSSPAILSTQSSPYRNIRHRAGANQGVRGGYSQTPLRRPPGDFPYDYDAELDGSESIRSFNSSADGDIDWDEDHSHRDDFMSVLPSDHYQPSVSDLQFRQSLMQRIHEWSAFAEEYNKSRSPTPDCPPVRFVRRSRSLDRNLEEPSLLVLEPDLTPGVSQPLEMEPTTERNLETLEYELHDIQGEFESITSKLHELIEQGNSDTDTAPTTTPAPHTHRTPKSSDANSCHDNKPRSGHHRLAPSTPRSIDHCIRTRWERVPSSACSDSSRSSRASSVEYVWDHADYHNSSNAGGTGELTDTEIALSAGPEVVNMCQPMIISDYVEREWKGDTEKARTIRQAYAQIPRLFSCHRLSVVRGDNYCGLRSTLFQVLSLGQRVTKGWSGIISLTDSLHDLYNESSSGLQHWTFGNRLPGHCKDRLASLSKCALSLYATIEEVCNLPSWEEREQRTMGLLNSGATFDLELLEGLKVMMALKMAELERAIRDGDDSVPVFAHLLMARDSSETMEQFVKNHLNPVGDTGGLEQVEMCLLGYTLGIRIRVLRLSQFGQQDFDCIFPEDVPEEWPEIPLIAEDDRHYNVPLP